MVPVLCWCCELAVCTQHHPVLSLERSLSIIPSSGSSGRQLCQGLYCLRAYFCAYNVACATSGSQPTIVSACFSMLHTQ